MILGLPIGADWYDIAARATARAANEVPPRVASQPDAGGTHDNSRDCLHIVGSESLVGVSSLTSPAAPQGAAGLSGVGA